MSATLSRHFFVLSFLITSSTCCTVWQFWGQGLSNNLANLYGMYPIFHATNGTFYLDNRQNLYSCTAVDGWNNGYFDFFETAGTDLHPWTAIEEGSLRGVCRSLSVLDMHDVQLKSHNQDGDMFVTSLLKLWKLRPHVQDHVDGYIEKLRKLDPPTIGFHIRGADKFSEDKRMGRASTMPADLVARYEAAFGRKGGTCVLVGNDKSLIKEMMELAAARIGCKIFLVHPDQLQLEKDPSDKSIFNQSPGHVKCQASLDLFADLGVLAHVDYFVGTYTSGIFRLVENLRFFVYGKDRRTVVDGSSFHHDVHDNIRKYFGRNNSSQI